MGTIKITANGKERELEQDVSIADFVRECGLRPERCLVELNGKVLRFDDFKCRILQNGDVLEIMSLVAGG